jgi:hypothetical protein
VKDKLALVEKSSSHVSPVCFRVPSSRDPKAPPDRGSFGVDPNPQEHFFPVRILRPKMKELGSLGEREVLVILDLDWELVDRFHGFSPRV